MKTQCHTCTALSIDNTPTFSKYVQCFVLLRKVKFSASSKARIVVQFGMGEEDTYQDNSCSELFNSMFRSTRCRASGGRTEFRYAAVVEGVLMQEVLMISVSLSQRTP